MGTEIDSLEIKIRAEADNATKSLDNLVNNLSNVQKNLKKLTSSFNLKDARGEVVDLSTALKNVGKDYNFKGSMKELDAEISKTEKRLERLSRREQKYLATGVDAKSKSWKNLQYDITETRNILDKLREQRGNMEVADPLAGMTITIDGVTESFEKWSDELKETGVDLDNVNKKSAELTSKLHGAGGFQQKEVDRLSALMNADVPTQSIISEGLRSAAGDAMNAGGSSKEFNKLVTQVQKAESALERLYTRQEKMQFLGVKEGSKSFKGLTFDIETAERKLKSLYEQLLNTSVAGEMVSESFGDKAKKGILSLSDKARSLAGNMKKSSDAGRSANFSMKNMIVSGLIMSSVFRTISVLTSGVGQGFTNLAQYCDDTNYSISSLRSGLLQLGNGFAAAFAPILNFVAPVLNQLINMLNAAASAISQFFAILTGKSTYISAKNNFQDYAAGLDGVGGSANGASDAMKELKRETLGFDEITKLSDNANSGGGSGGGSGSGSSVGDLFETKEIDPTLQNNILSWLDKLKTKAGPTLEALKKLRKEGLAKLGKFTFEGLKDFYNSFLVPVGDWTLGKGLPRFISITNEFLNNIDWSTINASLERFWKALAPFATGIGEGLINFYEDLTKVGADFINTVVPGGLDALSSVLEKFDSEKIEKIGYSLGAIATGIAAIKISDSLITKLSSIAGLFGKTNVGKSGDGNKESSDGWLSTVLSKGKNMLQNPVKDILPAVGQAGVYAGIVALANGIQSLMEKTQGGNGKLSEMGGIMDSIASKFAPDLKDKIFNLKESLEDSDATTDEFAEAFSTLFKEAGVSAEALEQAYNDVGGSINTTVEQEKALKTVIDNLADSSENMSRKVEKSGTKATYAYSAIKDALVTMQKDGVIPSNEHMSSLLTVLDEQSLSGATTKESINAISEALSIMGISAEESAGYFDSIPKEVSVELITKVKNRRKELQKTVHKFYNGLTIDTETEVSTKPEAIRSVLQNMTEGWKMPFNTEIATTAQAMQSELMRKVFGFTLPVLAEANVNSMNDRIDENKKFLNNVSAYTTKVDWQSGADKNVSVNAKTTKVDWQSGSDKNVSVNAKTTKVGWGSNPNKDLGVSAKTGSINWKSGASKWLSGIFGYVSKVEKDTSVGQLILRGITGAIIGLLSGVGHKADGGLYKNGHWSPITAYAGGGLPDMGELFVARESGPELVGRMGGGTAVMNNNQIVASVSAGVYQAVAAAMSQFSGRSVSEVHVHLEGDAEGVFRLVKQENDRIVIATGEPALLT